MIGIVIVGHGRLAEEYLAAIEHVMGPQMGIKAVSIAADRSHSAAIRAVATSTSHA